MTRLLFVSFKGYEKLLSSDESLLALLAATPNPTPTGHQEGRSPPRKEVWGVSLTGTAEVDCGGPAQPETVSVQLEQVLQRSVEENFPKAPTNFRKDLQQHLVNIQGTVIEQPQRWDPLQGVPALMWQLIGCYHRKIFGHLDTLLQDSPTTHTALVLLNWVLHKYFRYIFDYIFHCPPTKLFKRKSCH